MSAGGSNTTEESSELGDPRLDGRSSGRPLPLAGIRVLDMTSRVGAYCGKLLADLGADVVKIELPGGDALRDSPPFRRGTTAGRTSLLFAWYNNNKRGITLDWTSREATPLLAELSRTAAAVLVSPDRRQPLASFRQLPPHLPWLAGATTLCSITPYGLTGPWRDWRATPFTSFACSGQMYAIGPDVGPPVAMPGQQLYDEASTRAASLIVGVLARGDALPPQTIDIAAHDLGAWQHLVIERYSMIGRITTRATNFGPPPGGVWKCRDGYIDIAAHSPRHWELFVDLLGNPEDLTEPLYRERAMRVQLFDMLTTMIEDQLIDMSAHELVEQGQELGLPCALMYRPEEFLNDIQPRVRGTFTTVQHPEFGFMTIPGPSVHSSEPLLAYRKGAPSLGESNHDIYVDELRHEPRELEEWSQRGLI